MIDCVKLQPHLLCLILPQFWVLRSYLQGWGQGQKLFRCDSCSIGHNVGLSVGPQQVLWKGYTVVSLQMLLLLLQCMILEHYSTYFAFIAAIAALKVTMSVRNKFFRLQKLQCCYKFMCVGAINVIDVSMSFCSMQQSIKKQSIAIVHNNFVNYHGAFKSQ